MSEFEIYDARSPMVSGETYRIQVKIGTMYRTWHRQALTELVKLYDFGDRKIEVKTIEIVHDTRITNPNFYFIRITFLRTGSDASGLEPNLATTLPPVQTMIISIIGVVFAALSVSAVIWRVEHLVGRTGDKVKDILNPTVVIGTIAVFAMYIYLKRG